MIIFLNMDIRILCLAFTIPNILYGAKITVREEQTKIIRCLDGQTINVVNARYEGRPFYCSKNDVTAIVQTICQGKSTCTLKATDKVYTDSCMNANEILSVRYNCDTQIIPVTTEEQPHDLTSSPTEVTLQTQNRGDCFYRLQETIFYNGTTSITKSGRKCQRWDAQTPHIPKYWPEGEGHENFCRDQEGDEMPWCYTIDPTVRWEYCDIPACEFDLFSRNETNITTETTIESRSSMQNNNDNTNVTVVVLIGGCIVGLIAIAVIIAIYRRKSVGKTDLFYDDHVTNLGMNISSQNVDPMAVKNQHQINGYTNNFYQVQSEVILHETTCKELGDTEYSYAEETRLSATDTLPSSPSYDVALKQNHPVVLKNGPDGYSHANYFEETYEIPNKQNQITLTDDYSTPGKVACVSSPCHSCSDNKEERVYENEQLCIKVQELQTLDNQTDITDKGRKENAYANIECRSDDVKQKDECLDGNVNPRYMPMTFGSCAESSTEDNEYVPIMSPTFPGSHSDVFVDTYRY